MRKGSKKRNTCGSYEVLLMHNFFSSVCARGNRIPKVVDETVCRKDSLGEDITHDGGKGMCSHD